MKEEEKKEEKGQCGDRYKLYSKGWSWGILWET
jgi:hypothetical protein